MIGLLRFNLKRAIKNKSFIILNIITFVLLFVLFHIDLLNGSNEYLIAVDRSTKQYQQYFPQIDNNYFLSDGASDVIIHKENDKWIIHSKQSLTNSESIKIEEDIKKAIKLGYQDSHPFMYEYIEELNSDVEFIYEIENENDSILTFIATIDFFLIINFASTLANGVIYEKGSGFIKVLFTYINEKDYIFAKILEGFIIPLVQLACTSLIVLINVLIRYLEDHFVGLEGMLLTNSSQNGIEINISIMVILKICLIIISTLILIQIAVMLAVSRFTSNNQSYMFISIMYVGLLLAYFLLISFGSKIVIASKITQFLSYLPIFSMVLMPLRIIKDSASIYPFLSSFLFILVTIYILIKTLSETYKENMLKSK